MGSPCKYKLLDLSDNKSKMKTKKRDKDAYMELYLAPCFLFLGREE